MRPVVLITFAGLLVAAATASARQAPAPAAPAVTPPPTVQSQQNPTPTPPPATNPPAVPGRGQQPQPGQQRPQGPARGQTTPTPPPGGRGATTVPGPAVMAPRPEHPSTWQNIKIDVAITDSVTADVQTKKTVSLLVLDARSGQIRSTGTQSVINVDAAPTIRQDGRIYLSMTLEYQPELTLQQNQVLQKEGNTGRLPVFMESLSLILVDGKTMIASQSADPRSDRKVTVEITATVQK
jgi:hypothetical protein